MKRKLFLLLCALLTSVGMWAQSWTGNTVAAGTYYLYNVGSGQWLCAANDWGTYASLRSTGGLDLKFAMISEGVYTIDTKISNGGNNHFLLKNNDGYPYTDGGAYNWTFIETSSGSKTYYMQTATTGEYLAYDGSTSKLTFSNTQDANSQWKLVTKADRIAAMADATSASPVDASFLMDGQNLGRNDQRNDSWTKSKSGGQNSLAFGGANENFCYESFHTNNFEFKQSITGAPGGKYGLKVQGFYRKDSGDSGRYPYLFLNDSKQTLKLKDGDEDSHAAASNAFLAGKYFSDKITYVYSSGDFIVGTKLEDNGWLWTAFDNFVLEYYGTCLVNDAEAFSSGNETEPGKWYYCTVTGDCDFTSNAAATLTYTQDGSLLTAEATGTDETFTAGEKKTITLSAGRVYFKTDVATNIIAGTIENGTDVTDMFITNPSFDTDDEGAEHPTGWLEATTNGSFRTMKGNVMDGDANNKYAYVRARVPRLSQVLSSLPEGKYVMTALAKTETTRNTTVVMGSSAVNVLSDAAVRTYSVAYEQTDDSDVTISYGGTGTGNTGNGNFWVDDFHLTFYTELPAVDVDAALLTKGNLHEKVRQDLITAQTNYDGSKTVANYNALQTAIINAVVSKATYDATKAITTPGTDYTALIYNPSFSSNLDGWDKTSSGGNGIVHASEGVESYNSNSFNFSQTIEGLPDGFYEVSVQAYYRAGGGGASAATQNAKLYAGSTNANVQSINFYKEEDTAPGTGTWSHISNSFYVPNNTDAGKYVFNQKNAYHNSVAIEVTDGELEIGIKKDTRIEYDWSYWDNFKLTYIGETLPASLTAVSGKMNATVATAQETAVNAYNDENTIGNYNTAREKMIAAEASVSLYDKIKTAIDESDETYSIEDLNTYGQAEWSTQKSTISTKYDDGEYEAYSQVVNDLKEAYFKAMIAQGPGADFTEFITNPSFENDKTGWSVNYGSSTSHNSDEIQGSAGSKYFKSWRNTSDGGYVYQTINLPAGYYRLSVMIGAHQATNAKRFVKAGTTVQKDDVHNDYTRENLSVDFKLSADGNIEISAGCENSDEYHADDFRLTYLGDASANLKVDNDKLGTFIAPFDITLPAGVKAYSATSDKAKVTLTKIAEGGEKLEAGTPVIIYGDEVSVNQTFYGDASVTENQTVGALTGILDDSDKTIPSGAYVLQTQSSTQAFYKLNASATGKLNRCYVSAGVSGEARLVISIDEETAINAIEEADEKAEGLKDGKYLIEGKIVIVNNGVKYSANGQKLN